MATHVFIPVRGKRIRVTRLDSCGRIPAAGAPGAYLATDGFVSLQYSSVVEEGAEITQRNASGALCVNEKFASSFKRFTIEMTFCGVNPSLIPLMTNAEGYFDAAGDNAGFTISEGDIEKWFALELWTGLSGAACAEDAEEASGYILTPFVEAGTIGDIAVDGENAVTFSMTGAFTKGGNGWGVGPYHVAYDDASTPDFLPTALDPLTHFLLMDTGIAPPPSAAELQPMVTNGVSTTTTTIP